MSEPVFPIVIRLAGEPRGKGRPIFARVKPKGGKEFLTARTPERTREYEGALRYAASAAMGSYAPVKGPLAITVTAALTIPASASKKDRAAMLAGEILPTKKPDFDNLAKTVDALNEVVWCDDKQVVVCTIIKVFSDKPELRIVVRPARLAPSPENLL